MFCKIIPSIRQHSQFHLRVPRQTNQTKDANCPRICAPLKCGTCISDLKNELRVIMGQEKGVKSSFFQDRENLNAYLVETPKDLPPRTIKDSFLTGTIPLSKDEDLQEKYLSVSGDVRYGRLVEDIDMFSVMVLHKYILNPKIPFSDPSPYTIVTVMVDSLIFNYLAKPTVDVRISGHIANVGRSSAEVVIWLDQQFGDHWKNITRAKLIMAIRDANNKTAARINPLIASSSTEKNLIEDAQRYRKRLQRRSLFNLTTDIPSIKEQKLLHSLTLKTCQGSLSCQERLPMGLQWVGATTATSNMVAFPDFKNIHNSIFGGYIMRNAIELAFATCYMFCRQQGKLRGLTEIKFYRSIPVGSVLKVFANVAYTQNRFIQIAMHVEAQNNRDGLQQATNTFLATFEVAHPVQEVYPKTYREAMLYLDAARNLEQVIKSIHEPFYHIDYHSHRSLE